jgi:RNA polymerase sigma-70 factor (ECF subfamily)
LNEPDDVATMLRLREGDADAWDSLYRRYRERVWRYVASATGAGEETVADLVQETFLEAARSARSFDAAKGTPAGWILGIASRRIADSWRKTYRNRRLQEGFARTLDSGTLDGHASRTGEGATGESSAALSEPERSLSAKERAGALREALACLPGDYAELLAGKYFDDASLDDLAAARGESAVAISSRLARARDALRQALRRVLPDEFRTSTNDRGERPPPVEAAEAPVASATERRKPD